MAVVGEFSMEPMSLLMRFYVYAIHGYATEIMFTAMWEFVVNLNWKFPGITSIWTFPIYGSSTLVVEFLHPRLEEMGIPLLGRGVIYMMWTYLWEFSTGYVLKFFDACPWDYTPFHGDFMGLVTLEYAPFWILGGILAEKVVIKYTRCLYWGPYKANFENERSVQSNGYVNSKSL